MKLPVLQVAQERQHVPDCVAQPIESKNRLLRHFLMRAWSGDISVAKSKIDTFRHLKPYCGIGSYANCAHGRFIRSLNPTCSAPKESFPRPWCLRGVLKRSRMNPTGR